MASDLWLAVIEAGDYTEDMKGCRFTVSSDPTPIPGFSVDGEVVFDLRPLGILRLSDLLERSDIAGFLEKAAVGNLPAVSVKEVGLLAPVDRQPVWAAGVTYLRSKRARMEESEFSANAYDRVYDAARPELFFKSLPENVVPTGEDVGIRRDATWSVPEPELVLAFNSRGETAGFGIGNDMSSRDIEGENLLYLPQAKTYHRSCAMGPWLELLTEESEARQWSIELEIQRGGGQVFGGSTTVGQIKRSFGELGSWLFRCQRFPHGALLLTGTGIVPPDGFTLQVGDVISIAIGPLGELLNKVVIVD